MLFPVNDSEKQEAEPPSYASHDARWQAVEERDGQAAGFFVYAVRTTGIYCLPSCPSRRPRKSNAIFFDTCDQAERGGYRPCKKCQPRQGGASRLPEAVARACALIEEAETAPTLEALAAAVGLSPGHLQKMFKRSLGITPKAFADARRTQRFRSGLRGALGSSQGGSVTSALHAAGYGSSRQCYETAGERLGMTPNEYRRGGAGHKIRSAAVACPLGWLAVAATQRGICLIEFANSKEEATARVEAEFPRAERIELDAEFQGWVAQVVESMAVSGGKVRASNPSAPPLDLWGTAFQQRVWEALRAIPAGRTATYAEIAERLGQPKATRAVARACASNRVAVAIPCHRAVGSDGQLRGYKWGVERKRALLLGETENQRSKARIH